MLGCALRYQKTYYNDQHQKKEVIAHREEYIHTLQRLHWQMRVWVILSAKEEATYVERRQQSSVPDTMPLGEEVIVVGKQLFVRHTDDQEGWEASPVLHPKFEPGKKPTKEDWHCDFGHDYEGCRCHLEAREYGQDESVYRSGDHPSMRWGVDGRSYSISKGQGVSQMASAFKDYSKHWLGLAISVDELAQVNEARWGRF